MNTNSAAEFRNKVLFLFFLIFHPFFQGGQLIPFAPICGRSWVIGYAGLSFCNVDALNAVAPPGFCNRGGGSEVWVYRGSRVRSPAVPVVLSVYQRGSLLDGLAMYLSCDTKKFHANESTHILHNFWTSTHRGEASSLPPGGATG